MTAWETADPDARLGPSAEPLGPRETRFDDAQAAVNFVAFEPGWLPRDCTVTDVTRRPEQPPGRPGDCSGADIAQNPYSEGNACSLRFVVAGDGRRLRVKQFLYDWAPPAASVAPLWRTADPEPFECGDAVGWLGTDYEGRRGACVQRDRTQVELSVLDGSFDDEELRAVLDGLVPVATEAAYRVRNAPFHRLSYWTRYKCRPPGPSHGLWDFSPAHPYDESDPLSPVALAGDLPVTPLVPPTDRYRLDSAVSFGAANAVECVFRHRANASDHLWLLAAPAESTLAPSLPPTPSDQAAETRETLSLRGTDVHFAALTEEYGAWEAFWAADGVHYCLWAGASRFVDGDDVRSLVASLDGP